MLRTIKRKINHKDNIIDKLSITWEEQVYISNTAIGITCRSRSIDLNQNNSFYSFDGGCVEAYPDEAGNIFQLRCSKLAHNHSWFKTSYDNIKSQGTFWKTGEWKNMDE